MRQTKKGQQWFFGIKAHLGLDVDTGLVHTVRGTAEHVNDELEANSLLHGQEAEAFADAGYRARKGDLMPAPMCSVMWPNRPGFRKLLDKADRMGALAE